MDREKQKILEAKNLEDHERRSLLLLEQQENMEYRDICRKNLTAEPLPGPNVVSVKFRLPDGASACRRFGTKCDVEVLLNYVGSLDQSTAGFHLQSPSKKIITSTDRTRSLTDLGVDKPVTFKVNWDGPETGIRLTFLQLSISCAKQASAGMQLREEKVTTTSDTKSGSARENNTTTSSFNSSSSSSSRGRYFRQVQLPELLSAQGLSAHDFEDDKEGADMETNILLYGRTW
eukprot:gene4323-4897_t